MLYNFSEGEESKGMVEGKTTPDGRPFRYESKPEAMSEQPHLKSAPKSLHNSSQMDKK